MPAFLFDRFKAVVKQGVNKPGSFSPPVLQNA